MDLIVILPKHPPEPVIIIDGIRLTTAEAMTVRVAVGDYQRQMSEPGALGEDDHGEAMRKAYLNHTQRLSGLMACNRRDLEPRAIVELTFAQFLVVRKAVEDFIAFTVHRKGTDRRWSLLMKLAVTIQTALRMAGEAVGWN